MTKTFDVGDGCVLNFVAREVTIAASGELDIAFGAVFVLAGSFFVGPGGFIDGRGNQSAPRDRGGTIVILADGPVEVQRPGTTSGRIDVSGKAGAGAVVIAAAGSVRIEGKINADNLTSVAAGGSIEISAGGDITSSANSTISATGGGESFGGGEVDFVAGGQIDLGSEIDIRGGDGGTLDLLAGEALAMQGVNCTGTGDAGSGGDITMTAGTSLHVLGRIDVKGTGSSFGLGGGDGGFVVLEAHFGDLLIAEDIAAEGASPDGDGGQIDLEARGDMSILAGAKISVRGNGVESFGGDIFIDGGRDIIVDGTIDASGGDGGGEIDVFGERDVVTNGGIDASGRHGGSAGGGVLLEGGGGGPGSVVMAGSVDVAGGGCGEEVGCGSGGFAELAGCNVTVTAMGSVTARGPDGGEIVAEARESLTIAGTFDATMTGAGFDGENVLRYPSSTAPVLTGSTVVPPAVLDARAVCTGPQLPQGCLVPCPVCGSGIVEFPEMCDDVVGAPVSCDGCSRFCQLESCDDGLACTVDSCDGLLGCRHAPAPTPCDEPATTTRTPTVTPGVPPTAAATATATTTGTVTRTATGTATSTWTNTATATATNTPTATVTSTATSTATATATGTITETPTVTETPTETRTAAPTATATPVSAVCSGGTAMIKPLIKLKRLGPPLGDEKLVFRGSLAFVPNVPASVDPASTGVQILIEDLGSEEAVLFDMTHRTRAIPPGGPGSGCDADKDGWKVRGTTFVYKNRSNALDPPSCVPGSAKGLAIMKIKDKRLTRSEIKFIAKTRASNLAVPVGPLRGTVVLGGDAAAGLAGECGGVSFQAVDCRFNSSRTVMTCK